MKIRPYSDQCDRNRVVLLWNECGLTRPWNDPAKDIDRKLADSPSQFLVMENEKQEIIGSAMFGYDGHRGNIYYLAVHPDCRSKGAGSRLMKQAEEQLLNIGCPKINVMIRTTNLPVIAFYESLKYEPSEVQVMGKRLIGD